MKNIKFSSFPLVDIDDEEKACIDTYSIKSFADLGGRQIAVPYWYSMHNIILQKGLRTVGLKPVIQSQTVPLKPNQVNLFILPPPDMPLALAGRKIDGYIVAEPFNALAEIKIKARIMRFTGDIWKNHPCCVVVMHQRFPQDNPVYTQKVINALVKAQLWIVKNPEETAKILSREGSAYLPTPYQVLHRVFNFYDYKSLRHPQWQVNRIGFQPYPFPATTRLIVKEMCQTMVEGDNGFLKSLSPELVTHDLVDASFAKKAMLKFRINHSKTKSWEREEIFEI